MNQKLDEMIAAAHLTDLIHKNEEKDKKANTVIWVLAILGAITAVAAIAFAVVKYLTPSYLDDDFDDFDDDFDDDFYADDEVIDLSSPAKEEEKETED